MQNANCRSLSLSLYNHSALNRTLLRRHCRAQQTPNRTMKTHTESVLKNHFGGSQNRRLHRNTKTSSCHRLTRPPPKTSVTDRQTDVVNLYIGLKVVHNLIIVKLHGGTRVWMLKKGIIIIYIEKLTKHKKWLPFCVCLLKLSILSLYQTIMFLKMDIGFLD